MKGSSQMIALALTGLGLILVGVAAFLLFPVDARNDPTSPTDFSAVPVQVEFDAPALTLYDLHGVRHSLSDYRGQVVLVNLWATWCAPCAAEMPILQDYYIKHQGDGFTVVGVEDGDPAGDVLAFVKKYGLTFSIWLDLTYQATDHAFKARNLPSSYLIDRAGKVRLAWVGAINHANLEKYVTPLIKE
ncbi:MAG TPA: TlpA disulfide reductase family protein [Anaerolineales bacterium]|nr:TlpA disulfide reductase family protein [Anaerolineales bacterium]